MTKTDVNGHDLKARDDQLAHRDLETPAIPARLAFAWLDRMAATTFTSGETKHLCHWAVESARSLVAPGCAQARLRLLSRSVAIAAAQVRTLEAMLGEALARRDGRGADIIDKTLTRATKRLTMLTSEHRAECAAQDRTVTVGVGHAECVVINARR